jgi:AraC-like DNA-binding protein
MPFKVKKLLTRKPIGPVNLIFDMGGRSLYFSYESVRMCAKCRDRTIATERGAVPAISRLLLPRKELASFIAAVIYRDTRATDLSEHERMNYFPATPLVALTVVLEGQLHMGRGKFELADLRGMPPVSGISVAIPSDEPTVSWSPGAVVALTLAIYPDAWAKIAGKPDTTEVPGPIRDVLTLFKLNEDVGTAFYLLCDRLGPAWLQWRGASSLPHWVGSDRIADWVRHSLASSFSAHGNQSTRSVQRMLRRWTGRSRQSLEFYANLENLHQVRQSAPHAELAQTALDAGFADQSHMGRSLKRATGFSPAALNERIATDEAFWCYRLLGERF